jgi:hypothetical protein
MAMGLPGLARAAREGLDLALALFQHTGVLGDERAPGLGQLREAREGQGREQRAGGTGDG